VERFLLDESADLPLRDHLRARGHDATAIAHEYPASLADDDVLAIAVAENRILITNDRDFGELVFRRRLPHRGIILFRLGDEALPIKIAWLDHVLDVYADRLREFLVVNDRGVRVRSTSAK
jgi:predicted nuclease of predicted toxin-antitoxin system